MIDHSAISQGDALRSEIAAKVAAWEAKNGSVQTLPILAHDRRHTFRINCPERKQAAQAKSQATRRARP